MVGVGGVAAVTYAITGDRSFRARQGRQEICWPHCYNFRLWGAASPGVKPRSSSMFGYDGAKGRGLFISAVRTAPKDTAPLGMLFSERIFSKNRAEDKQRK